MKRSSRLYVLVPISIAAGIGAIFIGIKFIRHFQITDIPAEATIIAGVITLLGTIFSAFYKEISSFYKEKNVIAEKKWDLTYPLIKNYYHPLISAADSLRHALENNKSDKITPNNQLHLLFLVAVFFGLRLRFVTEGGSLILLSSTNEAHAVGKAYKHILDVFNWAGDETIIRTTELQRLFLLKNKPENPYVLISFQEDVNYQPSLQQSLTMLKSWLNDSNIEKLDKALKNYIDTFKNSVDKLYSAWGT